MRVYPVPNRCVRDPVSRSPVDPSGLEVSDFSPFWLRRLRDGDVSKLSPDDQEAKAKAHLAVSSEAEAAPPADHASSETDHNQTEAAS